MQCDLLFIEMIQRTKFNGKERLKEYFTLRNEKDNE